jgi:hypothetical protein
MKKTEHNCFSLTEDEAKQLRIRQGFRVDFIRYVANQ